MKTRPYVQGRRADAAAATAARIVEAATALFVASGVVPTLEAVAAEADVSVQTVLRKYGSKDGLFAACLASGREEVRTQRLAVTPGDVPGAIDNLLDHYDAWGDRTLGLLALEGASEAAAATVEEGRVFHREWVRVVLGPLLRDQRGRARARRLAQLVAITDVYTWKLLHRDQGLSRAETRTALLELVDALLSKADR